MNKKEIIKAGGVIVKKGQRETEVLLIKSSERGFSFPKGHLEKGETLQQCALRECHEETGLDFTIIKKLPIMLSVDAVSGRSFQDHYYLMAVSGGKLRKEKEDDELKWVPLSQVKETFTFQSRKEYIDQIKKLIVR